MRVYWQLAYHRIVVQYLISLREPGHALRYAIFSLKETPDGIPERGVTQIVPGVYVWEIYDYQVFYEQIEQEHRLFISAVRPIPKDLASL
jgi:hypothetical protein